MESGGIPIKKAHTHAARTDRSRLVERGLARFEVLGRDADRVLVRSIARRLADGSQEAAELRTALSTLIPGEPSRRGGILAALRRSPLVGAELDLERPHEAGRTIDL